MTIKLLGWLSVAALGSLALGAYYFFNLGKHVPTSIPKVTYHIPSDKIHHKTLDNGMHILVYQDESKPQVRVQIVYDVGSSIEESYERGLAHLVEHLIFKGTQRASESDIDTIARKYGASFNACTSYDYTSYYFQVDKANWKPFADILADSMQNSRFDEQHLASELRTVVQELNMYRDNHSRQLLLKAIELAFPGNHPYHFPIIGFKEELANLTAEDVRNFFHKYYHPSKATLFIAGDIDPNEAINYASQMFKDIPNPKEILEPSFPLVEGNLNTIDFKMYENVSQSEFALFWHIPGETNHQYLHIATLTAKILGDMNACLYRKLVDEEKIAERVSVMPLLLRKSGLIIINVHPKPGQTEACTQMIQAELANIALHGINPTELQQKVADLVLGFLEGLESLGGVVTEWMQYYLATKDSLAYFKQVEELYKITPNDIAKFIGEFLIPDKFNRIQLIPLAEKDKPTWQRNKQQCIEQEAKILQNHQRTTPIEAPKLALTLPDPQDCEFKVPALTRTIEKLGDTELLCYQNNARPVTKLVIGFKDSESLAKSKQGILVNIMLSMLLEGSMGFTKRENMDFLDRLGASYGFSIGGLSLTTLETSFIQALERFMHIICNPTFRRESLEKVKSIIIRQLENSKDEPRSVAERLMWKNLYAGTAWDWDYDQAISLVQSCTVQDLVKLHEEFINPAAVQMIIGGKFDYEHIKEQLSAALKKWPIAIKYSAHKVPAYSINTSVNIDVPMLRDQVVLRMVRPNSLSVYHPDIEALTIANFIGFYSLGSRIFHVREETGLFYTANGGIASNPGEQGSLDFITTIVNGNKVELAESALMKVLEKMGTDGVTQEEFVAGKRLFFNMTIDRHQTTGSTMQRLLRLHALGMPLDYDQQAWKKIQAMSLEELNKTIAKYFTIDNFSRIRVGNLMKQ